MHFEIILVVIIKSSWMDNISAQESLWLVMLYCTRDRMQKPQKLSLFTPFYGSENAEFRQETVSFGKIKHSLCLHWVTIYTFSEIFVLFNDFFFFFWFCLL